MKYCHLIHDYLYIDNYDGNISMCPWMEPKKACIGNLRHDEIGDAYNSDYANYLRSTIDDQSFKYCRREGCPYLQNNDLEEVSAEEYESRKRESYYPTIINLAYDFVCNQSCETCRSSVFVPPADYGEKMDMIRERISTCLNGAKRITASGHGDPFASKYMMEVLENLHPTNPDMSFLLETNGVFFDEAHWNRIKHLSKNRIELVVTINSFDEFTYKHVSRGGNYERMLHNLEFMSQLREKKKLAWLTNTLVIQDRNFREIPSFIKRSFEEYAFDQVILRPVYQWGTMQDETFWFKDVLNPLHPYHQEYLEIMEDPALKDPRVYHFGGNTVHEARPYPSGKWDSQFPYAMVKQNSRVIIYGAGQVGTTVVGSLRKNKYCEVVLWIDQCCDNVNTVSPDRLKDVPPDAYDYVVLATASSVFAEEMRNKLKSMDIPEERIVSCCGGC